MRITAVAIWSIRSDSIISIDHSQQTVTGEVRIRVSAGLARITGRRSPYSLYDMGLATYSEGDTFERDATEGFIQLFSLGYRTVAEARMRAEQNKLLEDKD